MRDGQTLTRASARRCAGRSVIDEASSLPVYRDANEREPPDTAMLSLVVDGDAYIKMFLQREGLEGLEVEAGTMLGRSSQWSVAAAISCAWSEGL